MSEKCPKCGGSGEVRQIGCGADETMPCPACRGSGALPGGGGRIRELEAEVKRLRAQAGEGG